MNKPLTLQVQEIEEKIVEILNEAHLPFYVLKTITKSIYENIERGENEEIQKYLQEEQKKAEEKADDNG